MHNKITVTAKQNLTVAKGGRTVNIVKGDVFEVHGKIFTLHGVIIDLTEFPNVFQLTEHPTELPSVVHYKFLKSIALQAGSKTVMFRKDDGFSTAADIVCIHGCIIDIAQYADILTVVPSVEDYIEIAGAGVASVQLINASGDAIEIAFSAGIKNYTGNVNGFSLAQIAGVRAAIMNMVADTPAYLGIPELISIDLSKCNNMKSVLNGAFYDCTGLTAINLPASVTDINDNAFYNCIALRSISMPNVLETIGAHAFENSGLQTIVLPDAVEIIGDFAFAGCDSMTAITLSAALTTICDGAFMECTELTDITIPANVTAIGGEAFSECSKLTAMTFLATVPPELGTDALPATLEHIYVPAEQVEAYQEAYADFAAIIAAIE